MNTPALNTVLTTYQAPYRAPLLASLMLLLALLQGSSATLTLAIRSPFASDLLINLVTVLWLAMYLTAMAGLIATQGINWLTWMVRYRLPLILLVAGTAFSTVWSVDANLTMERSIHLIGTTILALYIGFSLPLTRILRTSALTLGLLMLASALSALFLPSMGLQQVRSLKRRLNQHRRITVINQTDNRESPLTDSLGDRLFAADSPQDSRHDHEHGGDAMKRGWRNDKEKQTEDRHE